MGIICPSCTVEIGLTDLPKSGGAMACHGTPRDDTPAKATCWVVTDYYLIGSKEDVVGTAQQNCSHRKYGGGQPNKFSLSMLLFVWLSTTRPKHI